MGCGGEGAGVSRPGHRLTPFPWWHLRSGFLQLPRGGPLEETAAPAWGSSTSPLLSSALMALTVKICYWKQDVDPLRSSRILTGKLSGAGSATGRPITEESCH